MKRRHEKLAGDTLYLSQDATHLGNAYIYRSEMEFISRCILDYKNIETGGELFGFWTAYGSPVVLYAIGPGNNANHQSAFFNQDLSYLNHVGTIIVEKYGLHHIGEWHSHHQLGLAQPSAHDSRTMIKSVQSNHLHRFLCCIGNCTDSSSTLNAFIFTEAGEEYQKTYWSEIPIDSPFRSLIDVELNNIIIHPQIKGSNYTIEKRPNLSNEVIFPTGYWLEKKENRIILKNILDFIRCENVNEEYQFYIDEHSLAHISSNNEDIIFDYNFPNSPPVIRKMDHNVWELKSPEIWNFNGNIFESFKVYYKKVK